MKLALVPRTTEFYDLFTAAGENAARIAAKAEERFRTFPETNVSQQEIKTLEHEGDRLTREIIDLLNTQYITPFDRDDIYRLARAIDDIADHIENASELLGLYKVEGPMEQAVDQCRVLVASAQSLAEALGSLRHLKRVEPYLVKIKDLEDDGDRILRDAIAALFDDDGIDPRTIIRWKDIFEALEDAIDACDTAADFVGNIAVKNL